MRKITTETIKSFNDYLINEEKAAATVNKYLHDVDEFQLWLGEQELWHGNIIPQDDSRNNSNEMKDLISYMARHHEDLEKSFSDEQKETFEKFHDCWNEYMSLAEAAIFLYQRK